MRHLLAIAVIVLVHNTSTACDRHDRLGLLDQVATCVETRWAESNAGSSNTRAAMIKAVVDSHDPGLRGDAQMYAYAAAFNTFCIDTTLQK